MKQKCIICHKNADSECSTPFKPFSIDFRYKFDAHTRLLINTRHRTQGTGCAKLDSLGFRSLLHIHRRPAGGSSEREIYSSARLP